MKKRWLLTAAAMVAAVSVTGCTTVKADEVAVTVGDTKITADVANFYARYTQAQYETYYGAYMGDDMWNTEAEEGKTYEDSVKDSVLESLERMAVLEQHMEEYDVALTDAEKKLIKDTAKQFDEDNSLEDKEKIMCSKEAAEKVLTYMTIEQKMMPVIQEGADTKVSEKEAAQKKMDFVFFSYSVTSDQGASLEMTKEEKAEVKKQAEEFAEKVKENPDQFAELAKEYDQEVKYATFDEETQTPNADFVKAADALENEGDVTDMVEADAGCYIGQLTSLKDKDATESKKKEIIQERKNELYDETTSKWVEEADPKVNEKVWKKISFKDISVTMKQTEQDPYADAVKTDDQADAKAEE